jgi:transposase
MGIYLNGKVYDVIVGLDVDRRSYSVTCLKEDGSKNQLRIPASSAKLLNYTHNLFEGKRLLFAYEAGPTGWGLFDDLKKNQHDCLMIHPASMAVPANRIVKNNRLDSEHIAEQVKAGIMTGIRVPSESYRGLRHLISLRHDCAATQKAFKQKIRALLLFENLAHLLPDADKAWNQHYRSTLTQIPLKPAAAYKMKSYAEDLEFSRKKLLEVQKEVRRFCTEDLLIKKNLLLLESIPGIGKVIAPTLLARIGDPADLRNVRELGGFCGLVPRENSTGDKVHRGSISHQGDRVLRSLLIEGAWVAIRKDKELCEFYHRIKSKREKQGGSQIAITAVARKLTARIYVVLKEQREYIVR